MYAIIRKAERGGRNRPPLQKQAIAREEALRIAALPGFAADSEDNLYAMVLEAFLLVGIG